MKEYYFCLLHDDGRKYHFSRKFRSAFHADRWAYNKFLSVKGRKISYRIIFEV